MDSWVWTSHDYTWWNTVHNAALIRCPIPCKLPVTFDDLKMTPNNIHHMIILKSESDWSCWLINQYSHNWSFQLLVICCSRHLQTCSRCFTPRWVMLWVADRVQVLKYKNGADLKYIYTVLLTENGGMIKERWT